MFVNEKTVYYYEVHVPKSQWTDGHWAADQNQHDTPIAATEAARKNGIYPYRIKNKRVKVAENSNVG